MKTKVTKNIIINDNDQNKFNLWSHMKLVNDRLDTRKMLKEMKEKSASDIGI